MKISSPQILSVLALLVGASIAKSDTVTVPNSRLLLEGNTSQDFPFTPLNTASARYQQIFASSEFSSISGPVLITSMTLRPDSSSPAFTAAIGNIQINLSTTSRSVDSLSTTFATNVGVDDTVVTSGPLTLTTLSTGPANGPKAFDVTIPFVNPFLYNPSAGNLLLDVRNFSGASPARQLDAHSFTGDGVSRIYTQLLGVSSPTADRVDSSGLVVQFNVVPEPSTAILGVALFSVVIARRSRRS